MCSRLKMTRDANRKTKWTERRWLYVTWHWYWCAHVVDSVNVSCFWSSWRRIQQLLQLLLMPLTTHRMNCSSLVRVHFERVPHISTTTTKQQNGACCCALHCFTSPPLTKKIDSLTHFSLSACLLTRFEFGHAHPRFPPKSLIHSLVTKA